LLPPDKSEFEEFFAYGIRYRASDVWNYGLFSLRKAFDQGKVWRREPKSNWLGFRIKEYPTIFTIIDLAPFKLKGNRRGPKWDILSDSLLEDRDFRQSFLPYWHFINNGSTLKIPD